MRIPVEPGPTEAELLARVLDTLPIYAMRVGYRADSTPEERALADAAFRAHEAWLEARRVATP